MPLLPRPLRPSVILRRNAVYKGVLGGSKGWLAVGSVVWGRSLLKKYFGKNPEFLTVERLTKGQFLRIDAVAPTSRRQRRRLRRSAERERRSRRSGSATATGA
jgi:hypothetical protein